MDAPGLVPAEDAGRARGQGDGAGHLSGRAAHRHLLLRPHLQAVDVRVAAQTCMQAAVLLYCHQAGLIPELSFHDTRDFYCVLYLQVKKQNSHQSISTRVCLTAAHEEASLHTLTGTEAAVRVRIGNGSGCWFPWLQLTLYSDLFVSAMYSFKPSIGVSLAKLLFNVLKNNMHVFI